MAVMTADRPRGRWRGRHPVAHDRARSRASLLRDWVVALTMGEFVGFVAPAATGAALASAEVSDLTLVLGLTLAGVVEGLAIGVAGARVLGRHLAGFGRDQWVARTSLAAGYAWFVGMGGAALLGRPGAPTALLVVLVPLWASGLVSMGWAQWLVLRQLEFVTRSSRWIWVSAAAWLVGVAIPVGALSLVPNGWPVGAHVVVGVASAVAMGATVALLTGHTLRRLVAGADPGRRARPAHRSSGSRER